ncbi:MAG TPA: hypothetical protein VN408_05905, partial [Actinoplanes sp.]|nr:hypothetical protein [Actinoplanes sp.]
GPSRSEDTGRRSGGAKRGDGPSRPRYNANPTNWREDTASWDGDQDTSNWTRDPDTGQWSRAEDDPRVLAWRAEAARREAVKPAEEPDEEPTGRRSRRAEPAAGPARQASAVPDSAPSTGMPGNRPRSAMPAPADEGRRRRRSGDPGPQRFDEPESTESWQGRRRGGEPDGYPGPDGGRPGPRPPQWQEPEPRRSGYRDEPAEPSDYGQAYPAPQQRRSGFGSAARELPAGPSAQPQRPAFGARELPAGPSAQPQRPGSGGPQRELPAGPSAYDGGSGPSSAAPASAPSWGGSERQQRSGGQSWADQERSDRQQRPAAPSWDDQERPQRPVSGPAWADRDPGQQNPQRPGYGPSSDDSPWLEQERQKRSGTAPSRAEQDRWQPGGEPSWEQPQTRPVSGSARPVSGMSWRDEERRQPQQGPSYGAPRIPSQSPGYDTPSGETARRPSYGARELPAGSAAPSWTEQQKPAYGAADDRTGRWPDPLGEQSGRRGYDDQPPTGGETGGRPPLTDWLAAERADRRGADYRSTGAGQDGETDWRRELSGDPAEGESRRYSTSDFPPFRPNGSASVDGPSNLALSATSVISTAPAGGGTALAVAEEEDTSWPPRRAAGAFQNTGAFQGLGSYERRPVSDDYFTTGTAPSALLDPDDDEDEAENGSPLAAVAYTAAWYGVPVVLFGMGAAVASTGQSDNALNTFTGAAPGFAIALVLSMAIAYGLRSITTAWKSASVGLAAAVVGGGLATVLASAISGNSLS